MRRFLATLLACTLLACAPAFAQQLAAIPALDTPVIDTTGTLDARAGRRARCAGARAAAAQGSQLQMLMVPTTQPETIEQYTVRAFEQCKLGRKGVDDGVLMVVAKDDRRVRIEPGYGLEGAIPDAIANRVIQEYLVPKFRANDYGGGLTDATAALVKVIDGEPCPRRWRTTRRRARAAAGTGCSRCSRRSSPRRSRAASSRSSPAGIRGIVSGGVSGGIAWLLAASSGRGRHRWGHRLVHRAGGQRARRPLRAPRRLGRHARRRWGGGGGGFGGGGGGWSGGGGMSGGGGASGSW